MIDQIINVVIQYGVFAGFFWWLLNNTYKRNEAREKEYQTVIHENQKIIKEQAVAFTSMSKDLKEIKYVLRREMDKRN